MFGDDNGHYKAHINPLFSIFLEKKYWRDYAISFTTEAKALP